MTSKLRHHTALLFIALFLGAPAHAEYRSEGISEAQALPQMPAEKSPIPPDVMASVIAKVKANPALTQALIQANPRFKKILGLAEGASVPSAAPVAAPAPTNEGIALGRPLQPAVVRAADVNRPPSPEKLRLDDTLNQVRSLMAGGQTADYETAQRELASLPSQPEDENNNPPPVHLDLSEASPTSRRLLGALGPEEVRREAAAQSLEWKRKSLLQKEKRFAKYTNASGGAGLQASLEFNSRVRGAVAAPGENGYQLAMRDISETDRNDVPLLRPRRVLKERYKARPVGGNEEYNLTPHKKSYKSMMVYDGSQGAGDSGAAAGADDRHHARYNDNTIRDGK